MKLPIDLVPGAIGLRFRWEQTVDAIGGKRTVTCEGALPAGADVAVALILKEVKGLRAERERLMAELTKARGSPSQPSTPGQAAVQPTPVRKTRG